ncbi:tyrosine-type recombinase/integrase [Chloroflexota bacterium]
MARGHITKRAKDSYTIYLGIGTDPATGKYKQVVVTVKGTKKDAEKRLAELIYQHNKGITINETNIKFSEYLNKWLDDYAKTHLSPRGFDRYQGIIHKHIIPALGRIKLTKLKPEHLQKHYTDKLKEGLSTSTVRYHHAVIHIALHTAVKWGLVNRNVADAVDPPRRRRSTLETWGIDDINRFFRAATASPYYPLFCTALGTGMRRSELLGLQWQDVDFIYSKLYVKRGLHQTKDGAYVFTDTKSEKSRRAIDIYGFIYRVLKEHKEKQESSGIMLGRLLKEDDLVFCKLDGSPLRPNTVTRAWNLLVKQCGVKAIRLHDARHTHASIMLKQGIHPKIVQERLGHTSIQITLDTYSHIAPGLQEAAAKGFDDVINSEREEVGV